MKNLKSLILGLAVVASAATFTLTSCNSDKCTDVVCSNGGTCNTTDGSCTCASGYEGTTCQTAVNAKYAGTWSMVERNTGTTTYGSPYSVTIASSSTTPSSITMTNFGNYSCSTGGSIAVPSTVSSTGLTTNGVVACGTSWIINGIYAVSGTTNAVTGTYAATYGSPSTTDNMDFIMTKN